MRRSVITSINAPRRGMPLTRAAVVIAALLPLLPAGAIIPATAMLSRIAAPAMAAGPVPASHQAPLAFEPNLGQGNPLARFVARPGDYSLSLTEAGPMFVLRPAQPAAARDNAVRPGIHHPLTPEDSASLRSHPALNPVVSLHPVGANPHPHIAGETRLQGTVNYLLGPNPRSWHTGIPTYAQVRYAAIYPGVDLVYRGNGEHLEYDFVVAAGADSSRIRLAATGASLTLDRWGALLLHTRAGILRQERPIFYQQFGTSRRFITGGYRLLPNRQIGFYLGAYDRRVPLVIDPVVVYASDFGAQGGSGGDEANGVKVDAAGYAYVVGTTTSGLSHKAIFVTKYDPTGTHPLYTTLLSGGCDSQGGDIALDNTGNAYVTGLYTSKDANGICVVVQAVVAKLGPGGVPLYNVRFGGHQDIQAKDWGNGIAVDRAGNAYATGETDKDPQFPTTAGAFRSTPTTVGVDGFVLKITPTGKLIYATYLGGSNLDHAVGIAVDRQGDAYVTGQTASQDFPVTANAYQRHQGSPGDLGSAFVAKLNPTGAALLYSTYLGGSASDGGAAIAVDSQGHAYVTGLTDSADFPTSPGAYSSRCGADGHCGLSAADRALCGSSGTCSFYSDAFMAEIDPNPTLPARSTLVYATYLGGTLNDQGTAIAVDGAHHVYLAGMTDSLDFPIVAATQPARGAANNPLNPNEDAFVARFDLRQSGPASLDFSTYLGGSGDDAATGIAIGHDGTVYVAGKTASPDFPAHGHLAGSSDAFLIKLDTVTVNRAMLPVIDAVGVYHASNGKWAAATLIHRSEQTLLAVFFRSPQSGAPVIGRMTLTYHGKSSQTFSLVPYNNTQSDKVLGDTINWLPHGDNLGRVHVVFILNSIGAQASASTDFTIAP